MREGSPLTDRDVVLVAGADELEDVDERPAKMRRLYDRDNEDRSIAAIEAARCDVCGRIIEWRANRPLPTCRHSAEQSHFWPH
jgi:hypothetical protein